MQEKKQIVSVLEKLVIKVAKSSAEIEANTACLWFGFQPKEPESLKKLRKF